MKKFLVRMEGSYEGINDFHNSTVCDENQLDKIVLEYLFPYIELWKESEEEDERTVEELIEETKREGFYYEQIGYGNYLDINIQEI